MKKVVSLAIFATFLFLYLATVRPGVLPADSGEFQLAASQLQIAHPPGFPLYILIGWLFTQLPGSPASNLNFLSVLISSCTLGIMPLIMGELPRFKTRNAELFASIGGASAAILLGTSTTFWSQATTTNIRSLTTLLAALGFYFLLKWMSLQVENSGQRATNPLAIDHWSLVTAVLI
ncbi:MAG: hypothetical protein ACI9EW_004011, partial [Cellvibrionaceae bacterium]